MPYSDSNPERRNLTVLSITIIVYYLAGGKFNDGEVSLMLINTKFDNTAVLVVFVWVMLLWFWFRYFVTNRYYYGLSLASNKKKVNLNYKFVEDYCIRQLHKLPSNTDLTQSEVFVIRDSLWYMSIPKEIELKGFTGYRIRLNYFFKTLFTHRAASDYYTPYLLFFLAVGLGFYNQ